MEDYNEKQKREAKEQNDAKLKLQEELEKLLEDAREK